MKNKILMAMPVGGGIEPATEAALLRILFSRDDIGYFQPQAATLDIVRNEIVRQALATPDITHVFMLDSDVVPPDNIMDLLLECDSPMATAVVPLYMGGKITTNIQVKAENGTIQWLKACPQDGEPFEVENAGTGCVLIRREVFEKVPWPWFKFELLNQEGDVITEDIYFGNKAREYGYRYKVRPVLCGHMKKVDLMDIVNGFNSFAEKLLDANSV